MKVVTNYRLNFESKWCTASLVFAGLDLFARLVYYFGFGKMLDVGFLDILCRMLLPLLMMGAYAVAVRELKFNAPGLYGIGGSVYCLLAIIWSFSTGNFLMILASLVLYAAAALVLLAVVGGYIRKELQLSLGAAKLNLNFKKITALIFLVTIIFEFAAWDFWKTLLTLQLTDFLPELAGYFGIGAVACLVMSLEEVPGR